MVAADPDLTIGQKRRFLSEWAQDIESRQVGVDEGMGPASLTESDKDAQRLQRIRACLTALPADETDQPAESAVRRLWRRVVQS